MLEQHAVRLLKVATLVACGELAVSGLPAVADGISEEEMVVQV